LLTAFPEDDWEDMGADKMLVKPMQTAVLIRQIEKLLESHAAKLARLSTAAAPDPSTKPTAKKAAANRLAAKRMPVKKAAAKRTSAAGKTTR
jgi:DNA-binding response OmpR family regulator